MKPVTESVNRMVGGACHSDRDAALVVAQVGFRDVGKRDAGAILETAGLRCHDREGQRRKRCAARHTAAAGHGIGARRARNASPARDRPANKAEPARQTVRDREGRARGQSVSLQPRHARSRRLRG